MIVVGRLEQREYQDREGNTRQAWEVIADAFGPDLRFQTVTVTRAGGSGGRSQAPASDEPWATAGAAQAGAQAWGGADDGSVPF